MNVNEIAKGDTSVVIDGTRVDLQLPILESIVHDNLLILRLNDYSLSWDDPHIGRNVVAFMADGKQEWRIEGFWWKVNFKDHTHKVPDSYSQIRIGEDGNFYAYQPIGFICEIDLKTGKILHEHQTR